jgi:hypothetical protein
MVLEVVRAVRPGSEPPDLRWISPNGPFAPPAVGVLAYVGDDDLDSFDDDFFEDSL